jgi:hypothetical protein
MLQPRTRDRAAIARCRCTVKSRRKSREQWKHAREIEKRMANVVIPVRASHSHSWQCGPVEESDRIGLKIDMKSTAASPMPLQDKTTPRKKHAVGDGNDAVSLLRMCDGKGEKQLYQ